MVWTKLGLTKQRMRKLQPKKLHGLHLSERHYLIAGGAVLLTAALASSAVAKWGHSTDPVTVQEQTREFTGFWIRPCPTDRKRDKTLGHRTLSSWWSRHKRYAH